MWCWRSAAPPLAIPTTSNWRWRVKPWARASRRKCCAAESRGKSRSRWARGRGENDMRGFGEIAERLRRSTVQVFPHGRGRGGGSGVVWSSDGLILTNAHVARPGSAPAEIEVELWDGRRLPGRVAARDPRRDLATLRIAATGLDAATPGDSDTVRPGELVMAIGNPLGFAGALSTGVIHSIGKLPGMGRQSWIRAAVQLAPGNSGGPLANAQGRVVGINTAIVNGLGVAVPGNAALDFLRRGAPPSLGVA